MLQFLVRLIHKAIKVVPLSVGNKLVVLLTHLPTLDPLPQLNMSPDEAVAFVGEGWSKIVLTAYSLLENDHNILQVKEKFGGLRFYVHGTDRRTLVFIYELEKLSLTVCETCGKPGLPRPNGWTKTLCDVHWRERENRRLANIEKRRQE